MECKVSVIIPVYEVEPYLERAVDSVLEQTLQELEIVLVDDGSPDRCPEICDRYAREHPDRVQVVHQENRGLGLARNAGLEVSRGAYIAFLDPDDTVEPTMYEALWEKAQQGGYDLVMCDVRIRYVDQGRETVSVCYPREEVDLADYIARGNNITYSVNKLFARSLWEGRRYEKMLFEDIALIPALVTHARRVGYVPQAFYNYYRREGTLSTTQTGAMVDIVKAFRKFLTDCDPALKEETVYTVARQLVWNMGQSRTLFVPDFIGLLREFEADFRLNPYLKEDPETAKLLKWLEKPVVPDTFICAHYHRELPPSLREALKENFPLAQVVEPGEDWLRREGLPQSVQEAAEQGCWQYVEEYLSLLALWEEGGIVLGEQAMPNLELKRRRMEPCFFGFESKEELTTLCFGALPHHYVIRALLDSYEGDLIYNQAFSPLAERLRDFLITRFGLKMTGRRQVLAQQITVHLPSVLCYDFHDGDNCCKLSLPAPPGFEVVSAKALEFWSQRVLENWNLYKSLRDKSSPPRTPPKASKAFTPAQVEQERQKVARLYEGSTSWKITRPLRAVTQFFKDLFSRAAQRRP